MDTSGVTASGFTRNLSIGLLAAALYSYLLQESPLVPALAAIGFAALIWLHSLLTSPLVYTTRAEQFKHGATRRKPGDIPPVYPNGWWVVLFSHELKKGESKPVEFMGHSLVVFRGEDGVAKVLDAYCPHLGANLGIGSRVVGDSLECAFHGWRFDGQGKCTLIPQQNMIPANAKLNCWPVREINGEIVVWHHADHETPRWEIPDFTKGFYLHGTSEHTIACHVQEIAENGPDCTHLNFLHKPFLGSSGINRVLHHMWNAEWTPGTDENQDRHFAYIKMEQGMGSFGKSWPGSTVYIDILQCGPGMVHINMPLIPGLFNIRIIEEVLPIGPMMQRVRHSVWGSATTPRFVAKLLLAVIIRFVEQDIPIWNNKTYLSKPIFSKHDGSISVYRRWYQQFYTASSPKASSLLNPLDW